MKKTYFKPELVSVKLESQSMICLSNGTIDENGNQSFTPGEVGTDDEF